MTDATVWLCSHYGHSTGDCGPMCECTERIRNGTYGRGGLVVEPNAVRVLDPDEVDGALEGFRPL